MTWSAVTIGSLCERTATTDPRRQPAVSFRYIDISGINRDLKRIAATSEIVGADAPSRARQVVHAKDVLVSTVRPNLNAVAIVPDDLDGEIASTGFCVLRASAELLEPRFLFYFTRSEQFINALLQHVRGANYPAVTDRNVFEVEIPWPPKSEQQRISDVLDQADALRRQRRTADEKAQRILPALYHKLFGDPLASVNKGDGIALGELDIDLQNGFACGEKDVEDGVPHLRMNNIDDEGVLNLDLVRTVPADRDSERYRLAERDVLFMGTNSEDKIGKTCLFVPPDGRPYLFSNHLIRLRVSDSRVTPEYLAGFLHLLWAKGFYPSIAKRWVNQSSVAQAALAGVCIPMPSPKELQLFTNTYRELLRMRSSRVGCRLRIDRLFDVLLHRAFAGELTAGWREAHKDQLEAEMRDQLAALEQAKAGKPKRGRKPRSAEAADPAGNGRHAGTDMYNKAALVTYIAVKCHNPQRPDSLGRTKLAKLFYLVQRRAEISLTDQFARRAAGPLDDAIHKFLNLAKKQHWLALPKPTGNLKPVMPGDNPQPAIDHVKQRWADALAVMDEVLDTMKGWGWRALERWATVENAAQQLAAEGKLVTLAAIKGVIAADPTWRPKLDRPEFADSEIASTLTGLRKHGYLPAGAGANP
ncbi:MAG TPA: hypothetical protein DCX07_09755 [Phycisphaerales bacterium]|nr:hypothetical protein [Phycisphaerales bacterium]